MTKCKVSIVFPVYLDERVYNSVIRVYDLFKKKQINHEIIVSGILEHPDNLSHATYVKTHRKGKGLAVKEGVIQASGEIILVCDADFPVQEKVLIGILYESIGKEVVFGDRRSFYEKDKLNYSTKRRVISKLFNRVVSTVLPTNRLDTQCGLKCFKAEVAKRVYKHTSLDGFLSDIEVVLICRQLKISIHSFPLKWKHVGGSTFSLLFDTPRIIIDFFRLAWLANIGKGKDITRAYS